MVARFVLVNGAVFWLIRELVKYMVAAFAKLSVGLAPYDDRHNRMAEETEADEEGGESSLATNDVPLDIEFKSCFMLQEANERIIWEHCESEID